MCYDDYMYIIGNIKINVRLMNSKENLQKKNEKKKHLNIDFQLLVGFGWKATIIIWCITTVWLINT